MKPEWARTASWACAAALTLATAACGQGDSGNVMAQGANVLSPEQVDAALGPEVANSGPALDTANNAAETEAVDGTDAVTEAAKPPEEPRPEPEQEAQETAPEENNSAEE